MTISQAIQDAIRGGWREELKYIPDAPHDMGLPFNNKKGVVLISLEKILLDPLFWQALGKSRGWDDDSNPTIALAQVIDGDQWEVKWHHLIDHLASGKDITSFFEELV